MTIRALAVLALAAQAAAPEIRVVEGDWGGASASDIRKVLESAAGTLVPQFPGREFGTIEVSRGRENPITLFRRGPKGEFLVRLNVEGNHWAQFAYQFAHELGHILCRTGEQEDQTSKWLEETLCETASLFALRRMGETWTVRPPYPNWKGFAKSLTAYADERLRKAATPEGTTLPDWFRAAEPLMRAQAELRDKNSIIAASLLPLFEKEPARWEAVGFIPPGNPKEPRTTAQYLKAWRAAAPEKHRAFVGQIGVLLGVALD